ncbi:hypothetical protein KVH22_37415 [Streptomyces olivaceus]|uniref:hypothetical protein n=1 Tax=Streptomyces olivaceus TaxID=47716 RepID=UPI001CCBC711|nr:hypothetical protein [Streptomyces olivaceus]MBZ6261188.1 hypothetical protein [Streptomyces olivaceus]
MEAQTLVGLISGLGGAAIGAGGALLGGWLQQRHQAKLDREQREEARAGLVEERGRTAADKALGELYTLRRHVSTWEVDLSAEAKNQWYQTGHTHADEAELNAALIPEADNLRERLQDALESARTSMQIDAWESEHEPYLSAFDTEHAIGLLSAYMRGDSLPAPTLREERASLEREMRREAAAEEAHRPSSTP